MLKLYIKVFFKFKISNKYIQILGCVLIFPLPLGIKVHSSLMLIPNSPHCKKSKCALKSENGIVLGGIFKNPQTLIHTLSFNER